MHSHLVVWSYCGYFQVATPHTISIVGTNCQLLGMVSNVDESWTLLQIQVSDLKLRCKTYKSWKWMSSFSLNNPIMLTMELKMVSIFWARRPFVVKFGVCFLSNWSPIRISPWFNWEILQCVGLISSNVSGF